MSSHVGQEDVLHHLAAPRPCPSIAAAAISLALLSMTSPPCVAQTVFGTVVADATGMPVDSAAVVLRSLDGSRSAGAAVDGRGLFSLDAPTSGCYRLSVVLPREVITAALLSLDSGDTTSFHISVAVQDVVAGAAPAPVGGVTGRVVDSWDGRPVAGASVSLAGVPGSTHTDSDGRFHVPGVPAGRYEVTVERTGYLPLRGQVEVEIDRMLEVNVSLHPEATMAGRLPLDESLDEREEGRGSSDAKTTPGYCTDTSDRVIASVVLGG